MIYDCTRTREKLLICPRHLKLNELLLLFETHSQNPYSKMDCKSFKINNHLDGNIPELDPQQEQPQEQHQQQHLPIPILEIEIDSSSSPPSTSSSTSSGSSVPSSSLLSPGSGQDNDKLTAQDSPSKKSVLFDKVFIYHFPRAQGFSSIPAQGGSTLGMKSRHYLKRTLTVDMFEEVRRRSRREILLKIRFDKRRSRRLAQMNSPKLAKPTTTTIATTANTTTTTATTTPPANLVDDNTNDCAGASSSSSKNNDNGDNDFTDNNPTCSNDNNNNKDEQMFSSGNNLKSSTTSSTSTNMTSSDSDDDDESFSDYSDISDSELESDSYIFLQPIGAKLRRSLLRASGVARIDPTEKLECRVIRDSRERSGCSCVNQCIPGLCECTLLGVNCHVDRVSFPCGCVEAGCQNPLGRTEFDAKRVNGHLYEILYKAGIG